MQFQNESAAIDIPDGVAVAEALKRITHLGIGAHQDDLEFMAFHGIVTCFGDRDRWFGGITCSEGARCARTGLYADVDDNEMLTIRRREQIKAARIGEYGAMIQLGHSSEAVQAPGAAGLRKDLVALLDAMRPKIVYTHNLADKHETHVGVAVAAIRALRELPHAVRPEKIYGCEVWRDLDWLADHHKIPLDLTGGASLSAALAGVFDSQITGGKRYDLATRGRWRANATFFQAHAVDEAARLAFAMDLTPLIENDTLDIVDYVAGFVDEFGRDVRNLLKKRFES